MIRNTGLSKACNKEILLVSLEKMELAPVDTCHVICVGPKGLCHLKFAYNADSSENCCL